MSERVQVPGRGHRRGVTGRNVFADHAFGTYVTDSVGALKKFLHKEGVVESESSRLDTVMVEDVDHLFELISEHGIPLARDSHYPDERVGKRRLEIPQQYIWIAVLIVLVFFVIPGARIFDHDWEYLFAGDWQGYLGL